MARTSRFWQSKLSANRTGKNVGNLTMTGNRNTSSVCGILVNRMAVPFANEHAALSFEMLQQFAPLHGTVTPTVIAICCPT